jgi:hypothetical protein
LDAKKENKIVVLDCSGKGASEAYKRHRITDALFLDFELIANSDKYFYSD